jgi:hypothetical protein
MRKYTLPATLDREFAAWCKAAGDNPQDVIADLVDTFLDDVAAEQEVALSPAADAPPPRVTGRGRGEGFHDSDVGRRLAALMQERRKIRAEAG